MCVLFKRKSEMEWSANEQIREVHLCTAKLCGFISGYSTFTTFNIVVDDFRDDVELMLGHI